MVSEIAWTGKGETLPPPDCCCVLVKWWGEAGEGQLLW